SESPTTHRGLAKPALTKAQPIVDGALQTVRSPRGAARKQIRTNAFQLRWLQFQSEEIRVYSRNSTMGGTWLILAPFSNRRSRDFLGARREARPPRSSVRPRSSDMTLQR